MFAFKNLTEKLFGERGETAVDVSAGAQSTEGLFALSVAEVCPTAVIGGNSHANAPRFR